MTGHHAASRLLFIRHVANQVASGAAKLHDDLGTLLSRVQVLIGNGPRLEVLGPVAEGIRSFTFWAPARWVPPAPTAAPRSGSEAVLWHH